MAIARAFPAKLLGREDLRADSGFRVVVMSDSELYQMGNDVTTIEEAIEMSRNHAGILPVQIYNEYGVPLLNQD